MILRADFEEGIREVFTTADEERITEASMLAKTCIAIFLETLGKDREWVERDVIAKALYSEGDGKELNANRVRKNIDRIKEKFNKHFVDDDGNMKGWKISLVDNRKELAPVRDSEGKLTRAYKFIITPAKEPKKGGATTASGVIRSYLGTYVGRIDEVEMFQNLLENLDTPRRTQHILSLYGFGGIGKSSLLEIFRDIAKNLNVKVEPRFPRDEFVSRSISSWLSDVFILKHKKPEETHEEKWRDFLEVLEPATVVLIDTLATVDMAEFDSTLQSLSSVFKKARPDCLIVTATRAKPKHRENPSEIRGLSARDIKELVKLRGWNPEISALAGKLQKQTDGNPLMIECICKDENLWTRFKNGTLNLIKHSDPIAFLLTEMWDSVTEQGKEALKTLSLLSTYSSKWKFSWGKKECAGIIGASWDDILSELKGKCFIKEKEMDIYEMHELISDFALTKATNKKEEMARIEDYFSSAGREEIAIRFHAETSNVK